VIFNNFYITIWELKIFPLHQGFIPGAVEGFRVMTESGHKTLKGRELPDEHYIVLLFVFPLFGKKGLGEIQKKRRYQKGRFFLIRRLFCETFKWG